MEIRTLNFSSEFVFERCFICLKNIARCTQSVFCRRLFLRGFDRNYLLFRLKRHSETDTGIESELEIITAIIMTNDATKFTIASGENLVQSWCHSK